MVWFHLIRRAHESLDSKNDCNNEAEGNVGQNRHGQLWKEAVMDREKNSLSPREGLAKKKYLSLPTLPNSSFRGERKRSPCRTQISGSRDATSKGNKSTAGPISSYSVSSSLSYDPLTAGTSLTRRGKVSLGSNDPDPQYPQRKGRRFSLPGHILNPVSPTSSPLAKVPGSILNKANIPPTQNSTPEGFRKGRQSREDHSTNVGRARRYSLPLINLNDQGNTRLLTVKLPLGKHSQKDAVKARLSQLRNLGLTKKTTCRGAGYGKNSAKVRSPLIESNENCSLGPACNTGVSEELIQKTENEEEEDDDDDEDDDRSSEDPELRSIPKISLEEKMQRFFADYIDGAGQTGTVDFEQLLMKCRIGKEDTLENAESSQTEGSEVESEKECKRSERPELYCLLEQVMDVSNKNKTVSVTGQPIT